MHYEASSLEDIAAHFTAVAERLEKNPGRTGSEQRLTKAEATTWRQAADFLRNTKMVPAGESV